LIETLIKWELWDDLKAFTATPAGHPAHDITRLRAARTRRVSSKRCQSCSLPVLKALEAIKTETKLVNIDTSKLDGKKTKRPPSPTNPKPPSQPKNPR
jgi:hypothetical protein